MEEGAVRGTSKDDLYTWNKNGTISTLQLRSNESVGASYEHFRSRWTEAYEVHSQSS